MNKSKTICLGISEQRIKGQFNHIDYIDKYLDDKYVDDNYYYYHDHNARTNYNTRGYDNYTS